MYKAHEAPFLKPHESHLVALMRIHDGEFDKEQREH